MRALFVSMICVGLAACGAGASSAPAPVQSAPSAVATEPTPVAISGPPPGVDVFARAFTIDIAQPESGGVHHCLFVLTDGCPRTWSCYGRHPLDSLQSVQTDRDVPTRALVAAVDDWGTPLTAGEPDAPITLTMQSTVDDIVRTGTPLESEPSALRALREELMSAAQAELTTLRTMTEDCAECPVGSYCSLNETCSTFGSDQMKDCVVVPRCTPLQSAGSECIHDYECRSRRCSGRDELFGRCE